MKKKYLLRGLFFLSFFLSCFALSRTLSAAFFDPKLKWQTLQTEHFNIHFHNGEEELAYRMGGISEKVYVKLSAQLQWKPWGRTEVVMVDNTDAANALATTLPYNYVLLFVTSPNGTSSLNYYENWLEDLFTHEFTHILHIDKYGSIVKPLRWIFGKIVTPNGLTPGWVREGIAVYDESEKGRGRNNNSFSDMMLRTDILNKQFLAIDEAVGFKIDWPSSHAPYIYGGAFWQYLADTYGPEKITEFITRYGDSLWLFSLNNKARNTYNNKNFLKLWREWKESLQVKYEKVEEGLKAKGLTSLDKIAHVNGTLLAPTVSPDGKKLVYCKTDKDVSPQIRLLDLESKKDELLLKGRATEQISFSPDGKKIVFSSTGKYKYFYVFNDVYELDLETKKLSVITKGQRASDPDYSPDGKSIVFVKNKSGSTQLYLYDRETKNEKQITQAPSFTQFSNPRFSPDGQKLVVSAWMNGNRDIYIFDLQGKILQQVTHDAAIDNQPRFSADGKWIYFTSDRSGISNIYKIFIDSDKGVTQPEEAPHRIAARRKRTTKPEPTQLSNVLTGVFYPQPIAGTNKVIVQNYFGRGYDIMEFEETNAGQFVNKQFLTNHSESQAESLPTTSNYKIEKYNPFKKLFIPRYLMPGIYFNDGILVASASIANSDPLGRHIWVGDINYRSDAQFVGGDFIYTYNRWYTPLYVGYNDFVVNYGDVFRTNHQFFEEHKRVFGGVRLPLGWQKLDAYYYFEDRSDDKHVAGPFTSFLNLGKFAGFNLTYTLNRSSKFPASISPEGGPRFRVTLDMSDTALGASHRNQTKVIEADLREYIPIPWAKHHVFALRAAGGYNFGDKIFQGVFRLGSSVGEGVLTEYTPRLYPLRGLPQITFAGEGAMLFSGEYRFPLVYPQRGLGTGPLFLKDLNMALFADYGTVFDNSPKLSEFLLGVGAELRGDFVIGYGLPITGRLGYGIIVKGREFLGGLTDPLTKTSIKNGVIILQLGTSF